MALRGERSKVGLAGVGFVLALSVGAASAPAASFRTYDVPAVVQPEKVVTTADGNVWLSRHFSYSIGRMTPNGDLTLFSSGIEAPGEGIGDLVVGPDGNLWFLLRGESTVGRMTLAGALTLFPVTDAGNRTYPERICVGPDGALWFTLGSATKLGRITTQGTITFHALPVVPDSYPMPGPICAGPDGALWFTDRTSITPRIGRLPIGGEGTFFPLPAGISETTGIVAGPDGNLWFGMGRVGESAGSIARMTPAGSVTAFPTSGRVSEVCVGADGNVWFTEPWGPIVGRVTMAGAVTEFTLERGRSHPTSLAPGPDGNLWICDFGDSVILSYSPAGTLLRANPTDCGFVEDLAVGQDGNTWFTDDCGKIERLTPAGEFSGFLLPSRRAHPTAITPGPEGSLWFLETSPASVGRISLAGEISRFPLPGPNVAVRDLVTGPDGRIWITEATTGKVDTVGPEGVITEIALPDPGFCPDGIAVGVDGNLWVLGSNNRLGRLSLSGDWAEWIVPVTGMSLESLACGTDGSVWLTAGADWIVRYVPGGTATTFRIPTTIGWPVSIVSTPGGDLWFGESQGERLGRITLGGEITEFQVPRAQGFTAGGGPARVTVSPQGDVWFTERGGSRRIGVLRLTEQTSFFTLPPCRILDTRGPAGPLGGPALMADERRVLPIAGGACGVPAEAQAVSANVTVTGAGASGRLSIFGTAESEMASSSRLEFPASRPRANNAILRLATDGTGRMTIHNSSPSAADVIVDVNGYFANVPASPSP